MERKNLKHEIMVNTAICPMCGAECVEGNDEDLMITCAFCGHTFRPKTTTAMTEKEYREKTENALEVRNRSGWVAFRSK